MFIKTINIKKTYIILLFLLFIIFALYLTYSKNKNLIQVSASASGEDSNYIKWFEFNATYDVLDKTSKLDINSHINNEEIKFNWIELISYLATKYGGDFNKFNQKDLDTLVQKLKNGESMENIVKDLKNYAYYFECYNSVLNQFIGDYEIQVSNSNSNKIFEKKYGIKAFLPVAKNYSFNHYNDFGASRSYGYKRIHLGHDLMGSIGTPIIAVESGTIESLRLEPIWWLENWY